MRVERVLCYPVASRRVRSDDFAKYNSFSGELQSHPASNNRVSVAALRELLAKHGEAGMHRIEGRGKPKNRTYTIRNNVRITVQVIYIYVFYL